MFESSFWTFRSHQNYFSFSLAIGRVLFTGRSPSTFQCQQPIPSQRPPAKFFSVAYSQVICSAPLASLINDQRGSANSGRRPSPNNGQRPPPFCGSYTLETEPKTTNSDFNNRRPLFRKFESSEISGSN